MLGSVASGPPCCPALPRRRADPGKLPQAPEIEVDESWPLQVWLCLHTSP